MEIGIKEGNVLPSFAHMAENLQSLIFMDESDGQQASKMRETCENFAKLFLLKMRQEQ